MPKIIIPRDGGTESRMADGESPRPSKLAMKLAMKLITRECDKGGDAVLHIQDNGDIVILTGDEAVNWGK
jgi:hypothetical protein